MRGTLQPASSVKRVVHTDAEWKKVLTNDQFYVTRRESTDRAFTGTYYKLHEHGMFRCVCCANAVFHTDTKFDSGTGWPSFWTPIAKENVSSGAIAALGWNASRYTARCAWGIWGMCSTTGRSLPGCGTASTNRRCDLSKSD